MKRPLTRRTLIAIVAIGPIALATSRAFAQDEDARALLSLAATTMSELESFHFEMETIDGRSTVFDNLEVNRVVGDVARPDSFRATITARVAIATLDVEVVSIGGAVWVTDPLQGGWRQIADGSSAGAGPAVTTLINPDELFLKALGLIEEAEIEGTETIGEIETTIVTGTFQPSRILELATPEVQPDDEVEGMDPTALLSTEPVYLTAWIDAEGRVHKIEEAGPLTESESRDVLREITFTAFNDPVEIEPPDMTATRV